MSPAGSCSPPAIVTNVRGRSSAEANLSDGKRPQHPALSPPVCSSQADFLGLPLPYFFFVLPPSPSSFASLFLHPSHHALPWSRVTSPAGRVGPGQAVSASAAPLPVPSSSVLWELQGVEGLRRERLHLHQHAAQHWWPPAQGPHLARGLSFPGCKLPPTAPWHPLRFQLHGPFLFGGGGGFREGPACRSLPSSF